MEHTLDNWTLEILTIPSRDFYLRKLIDSTAEQIKGGLNVRVLYNSPEDKNTKNLAEQLQRDYPSLQVFSYRSKDSFYGISEGRNHLLQGTETPLVAFIDDDCSFDGESHFEKLEDTLRKTSLALVGLPSLRNDSGRLFKPRKEAPKQLIENVTYMDIEGMFAAGYTQLLKDIGGFNERRRFRMEWVDLNTRLHRMGFTTGIDMNAGFLRQWFLAPDSATRGKKKRISEALYCFLSTIIEFDCCSEQELPERMFHVAEKYFLRQDNGKNLIQRELMREIAKEIPRVFEDRKSIERRRTFLRTLPFKFLPYEPITREDWLMLIDYSKSKIEKYKESLKNR